MSDSRFHPLNQPKVSLEERKRRLMTDPKIYEKVQTLAKTLTEHLTPQTKIMIDVKPGAEFKDNEDGKIYTFNGVATPWPHSDIITLVCDVAQKPLDPTLTDLTYFFFSEKIGAKVLLELPPELRAEIPDMQGANRVISGRDFLKYFACGKWSLLEAPKTPMHADDFCEQKDVLKRT